MTHYWQLKVVVAFVVFNTVLTMFSPSIIGSIIDVVKSVATETEFVPTKGMGVILYGILAPIASWISGTLGWQINTATLGVFAFALIFVAGITSLLSYIQRYLSAFVYQGAEYSIRNDLYNSLLEQSFSFYDQQRTGQLMSRATTDIGQLSRFYRMMLEWVFSRALARSVVDCSWCLSMWRMRRLVSSAKSLATSGSLIIMTPLRKLIATLLCNVLYKCIVDPDKHQVLTKSTMG